MVDTPESQSEELLRQLFNQQQAFLDSFTELFKKIGVLADKSGGEAINQFADSFNSGVNLLNTQFSGSLKIDKIFKDNLANAKKEFKDFTTDVGDIFESSSLSDFFIELGVDPESMKQVRGAITDLVDQDFVARVAIVTSVQEGADAVKKALSPLKAAEDKILSVSRRGEKALRGMLNPLSDDRPFKDLTNAVSNYRKEIIDTVMKLGIAPKKVRDGFDALSQGGLALEQIQGLKIATSESGEAFNGLGAALLAARSTGLNMEQVTQQLNMRIRTLGTSAKEAGSVFEVLQRVQANTTLSITTVSNAIAKGQETMKFFGDATESSATIFKSFVNTLGTGREELAKPLFDAVIGGIQQLANSANMGTRAFIGMATGIGGGAGPIGAGLRVEEALTTGEGLEEVLEGVRSQIEQLSGAELLTRTEAIDTGQEQQFEIQRRLLQQFLGVQGAQQQNLVLEALRESDFGQIRDQLRPTGGGLATGLGRETIATQEGAIGMITNRLDVLAQEGATEQLSNDIIEASKGINLGAESFSKVAENLRDFVSRGTEGIEELFARVGERRERRERANIEEEAQKALTKIFDMGGEAVGPPAEELQSFAAARQKAGASPAEELNTLANVLNKTGVPLAEGLNGLSKAVDLAGFSISEGLGALQQVRDRTGARSALELDQDPQALRIAQNRTGARSALELDQDPQALRIAQIRRDARDVLERTREGDRNAEGAEGRDAILAPEQKEINVVFKAEMDPNSGFINLTPVIQNIARPIAAEEAERVGGRQDQ